jgi:uncharacterized membrane protein
MNIKRSLVVSAIFIAIAIGVAIWLYPSLPAQVPTHWDAHGQVNGYTPRFWAAAMPALIVLGLAILTAVLPYISPRRFEIKPFGAVFVLVMLLIQGIVLVITVVALLAGAGYSVPVAVITMLGVGLLFMVLGNYMGKLRKNFFIGIRTPWTLASDATWERTHRLGGWTFMAGGVLFVIAAFVNSAAVWLPVAAVVVAAGIPVAYSFIVYKQLEKRGNA